MHTPGRSATPPMAEDLWETVQPGLTAGALTGILLFGLCAGTVTFVRHRTRTRRLGPFAPSRPSVTWLRRHATRELGRLRALLPASGDGPGRAYALRAYEAARLLSEGVGARPDEQDDAAVLDLVGVVVLARQGQAVLAGRTHRPRPPCFVNPLHGPSSERRTLKRQGDRPVCAVCAQLPGTALRERTLTVPGGRLHYNVRGRWQPGGFGSRCFDLAADVLESLGER